QIETNKQLMTQLFDKYLKHCENKDDNIDETENNDSDKTENNKILTKKVTDKTKKQNKSKFDKKNKSNDNASVQMQKVKKIFEDDNSNDLQDDSLSINYTTKKVLKK